MLRKDTDLEDFYALLGLDEFRFIATDKQIKTNWKTASLVCHPDKATPEGRPDAEIKYKAMQKAYDTLLDKKKRMDYDSALPFNDGLPSSSEGTSVKTFYSTYGPVFKENARFSEKRPVPDLGDDEQSWDEVNAFYDFWFAFKSWRAFSHLDEHHPNDDTSRDERRWMEKKNAKLRAGKKKEEVARVRKLVEDAMKKDPRVQRHRAQEEEIRQQKKKAKELKKQEREAEAAKRREEAKRKEEEKIQEEQRAKERAKEAKLALKKLKQNIRKKCRTGKIDQDDMDLVLSNLTPKELEEMFEEMNNRTVQASFKQRLVRVKKLKQQQQQEREEQLAREKLAKRKAKETQIAKREWTEDEESAMAKAIIRYPGGSKDRWVAIANAINHTCFPKNPERHRTTKEVIRKAKEETTKKTGTNERAFETYQEKMKPKKEKLEEKEQALAKEDSMKAALKKTQIDMEKVKKKTKKDKKKDAADWTADQQFALEKALKSVPKCEDRWDRIAELVDGKTKKDCVKRFKMIRAQIMEKKKATS